MACGTPIVLTEWVQTSPIGKGASRSQKGQSRGTFRATVRDVVSRLWDRILYHRWIIVRRRRRLRSFG